MTDGTWLGVDVGALARERILDAAGTCFGRDGGARTNMADIAEAAGCSRATLYRYFVSRDALRSAYVEREARRIGELVARDVAALATPERRAVEGVLSAIRRVRAEPSLHAWFATELGGVGPEMARADAIESLVAGSFGDRADPDAALRARWVIRVIVSFLTMPGSPDDERAMVERFLAPAILFAH